MSPPNAAPPLSIVCGRATDMGKRRENNEDYADFTLLAAGTPHEGTLLTLSDGVGGAKAGEVASKLTVQTMQALLAERLANEPPPADRRGWIDAAIREADRRLRATSQQPGLGGMGATLSVVWLAGREAWWGQAGDSRTYFFRGGELRQLSQDQSPVGRLRASGQVDEAQARAHPYRHLIDQCLGGGGAPIEPETGKLGVEPGDVFLLCSDGLCDGLWDREIAEVLKGTAQNQPPEEVARALVSRANEASGKDNITAIVARAEGQAVAPAGAAQEAAGGPSLLTRLLRRIAGKADAPATGESR